MTPDTVPGLLRHSAGQYGDHPAIVDGDRTLSYRGLDHAAHQAAAALLAAGIAPGDRVAVWCPNRWEFAVALLGAECLGASLVPLNTRYKGHEARAILARARASALFVANGFLGIDYLGLLHDAGGPPPDLRLVVDVAAPRSATGVLSWEDFLAGADEVLHEDVDAAIAAVTPDTVCDVLFTSGTTGEPKGVMSSHRQTVGVAAQWARGARLGPEDRYAVVNPFFHSFGYKAGLVAALTRGTTVHPVPTFDPAGLMELIERERVTVLPGAPTIFTTLLDHPDRERFDLSSLRFAVAGATSVPDRLFEDMIDVLGFESVGQAYGLTECVLATQSRPGEDPRHVATTTGPAVPGMEVRLADDGEILLRGDHVMLGYFEDPRATRAAIDTDGWLHTGDVGSLDEHGCLAITDRIKDVVIVGGFTVYPGEVEKALSRHPAVAECAVVGVPDERLGAVCHAYVVARAGADVDTAGLLALARERLANFKVPRQVTLVPGLPRNAAGKVRKQDLQKEPVAD
ncbi:AMP-binding protein [Streptomyces mirabilis]|uniref:AMP-binding protein n=1 Tax=Streptomyces mirabilis TaxID=68239 RepID=UPI0033B71734